MKAFCPSPKGPWIQSRCDRVMQRFAQLRLPSHALAGYDSPRVDGQFHRSFNETRWYHPCFLACFLLVSLSFRSKACSTWRSAATISTIAKSRHVLRHAAALMPPMLTSPPACSVVQEERTSWTTTTPPTSSLVLCALAVAPLTQRLRNQVLHYHLPAALMLHDIFSRVLGSCCALFASRPNPENGRGADW